MSAAGAGAGAGAAAAAAAAAARRRRVEEEEQMTGYGRDDLDGWEFKILRTTSGRAFARPDRLRAVLDEEQRAGWELVEKFDDHRLRMKRRTDRRGQDTGLPFDPYRTWIGTNPNAMALRMMVVLGVLLAVGGGLAALLSN